VFVLPTRSGSFWYAVEDSCNVNCTDVEPTNGCDIEELPDHDTFTWPGGIDSEATLETAVDA
jgi:hypothetical protein